MYQVIITFSNSLKNMETSLQKFKTARDCSLFLQGFFESSEEIGNIILASSIIKSS